MLRFVICSNDQFSIYIRFCAYNSFQSVNTASNELKLYASLSLYEFCSCAHHNFLVNSHTQILLDNMAFAEDDEALQDDVRILLCFVIL